MAVVASGIICAWDGTIAGIPTHWSRVAALDGRYPRGAAATINPGGTGGSATHTHPDATNPHTHSVGSHTHTVSTGPVNASGAPSTLQGAQAAGIATHTHTIASIPASSDTLSGSPAWGSAASDPPTTYSVIWCQSDGTPTGFPANALLLWSQQGLPAGWTQFTLTISGSLQPVYLIGAVTAANGGATGGTGTTGHSHTDAGHTHTLSGHLHAGAATGTGTAVSGSTAPNLNFGSGFASSTHTHAATLTAATSAAGSGAGGTTAAAAAEPPYNTLTILRNASGGVSFPAYVIALWTGLLAAIPSGWQLCDGTNGTPDMRALFAKGSLNLSDADDTGGSLSHTHTAPTLQHLHDTSHVHPMTVAADAEAATMQAGAGTGTGVTAASSTHTHVASVASDTTGGQSGTAAMGVGAPADTRPPYTDVAFVMYTAAPTVAITSPAGGAVLSVPTALVQWAFDVLRIQVDYRLQVFASDGVTLIYDSGTVVSSTQQASIPVGYLQDATTYKLQVTATDSGHQQAVSAQVSVSTSWTQPPTPGGLALSPLGGT